MKNSLISKANMLRKQSLQLKVKSLLFLITIFNFGLLTLDFTSAQVTYEGSNIPYIHPRSEWLTTPELQNLFNWQPYNPKEESAIPDYYPVRQIILHDTACNPAQAGCNDDLVPTVTTIQNIYRFHAVTRGWGDIGYHFIIDRQGGIWEGRFGGNTVRGAHLYKDQTCQNFNVGSVGISLIGNYANASFPEPMRLSLERLVAWIAHVNNLTLQENQTIPVWTNSRDESGRCTTNGAKGFTTSFTGPTILTHREIEPGNSDIKNINLNIIRTNALAIQEDLRRYAYKEQGTGDLFDIVETKLQAITTTSKNIITTVKSQLDFLRPGLFAKKSEPKIAFPQPSTRTFPDGTLLRAQGEKDVYLVKNQQRIHISSAAMFNGLGLAWEDIQIESAKGVSSLALREPIVFPNGILLQAQTPDVYYIADSKRYLISSPSLFVAHGFAWENIVQVTLPELDRYYPWGGYVKWPEGSVLQNKFNPAQTVVVTGQSLEPVSGARETQVNEVNGRELSSYQTASIAVPGIKLALAEAFNTVRSILGLAQLPTIQAAQPEPVSQIDQTSQPIQASPEPTIKIALCKTRDIGGDIAKCSFTNQDSLTIVTDAQGINTVQGFKDHPGFNPLLNDNEFRGKVYTLGEGTQVWLINELPMEEYLKGIAETLGTDNPEYRKALITMARSYAYNYIHQDEKYKGKPFNLTNTAFDQLYRGYSYEKRSNGLPAVVDATKGQIIMYQGKAIVAAYSSDSGGITNNPCPTIFPKYCDFGGDLKLAYGYLRGGIADPEGTIHNQSKIAASHGVGVSTTGARRLIELGKSFTEVITFYYSGVDIKKHY